MASIKCKKCNGTGEDGYDRELPPNPYICEECNGTGKICDNEKSNSSKQPLNSDDTICSKCDGSQTITIGGFDGIEEIPCPQCNI